MQVLDDCPDESGGSVGLVFVVLEEAGRVGRGGWGGVEDALTLMLVVFFVAACYKYKVGFRNARHVSA